jgi:lipopolysaccharide export system protein LptC
LTPFARTLWRAWDRVTIYLPVILMGLMALGTYWLARNTPSFSAQFAERAPTHEPDYFMRGFSVKSFDPAGRLKTEVYGKEARHYPDTDTMEIDQPRIRAVNAEGVLTVATADRAVSNGDASELQLIGHAVVTRDATPNDKGEDDQLQIRGEFLHVFLQAERVRSHKPVVIRRGANEFQADNLQYDHLERVLEMQGRVRGTIAAQGER